jgi:Uncharacterised protein family (UPF0175)
MSTLLNIEFEILDDTAQQLHQNWSDLPRRALEALAAEGYRSSTLTASQVQHMLALDSRWAVDAFLKAHQCYLDYEEDALERDVPAIRRTNRQ